MARHWFERSAERYLRYKVSEKLEIIRLVEGASLPIRRTLAQLGIPKSTFYGWYNRYLDGGAEALEDRRPSPERIWNKVPDAICDALIKLVLKEPERSFRELAVTFTETRNYTKGVEV